METVEIHCSGLTDWMLCEKSAVRRHWHPEVHDERVEHVATWMGSAVHASAAGVAMPPAPDMLVFDKITPTLKFAYHQIERMAAAVEQRLEEAEWNIDDREFELPPLWCDDWPINMRVVGRGDVLGQPIYHAAPTIIADIKTAADLAPAWVQLGGYAALYNAKMDQPIERVATIHCPRPDLFRDETPCDIYYADALAAEHEALKIMDRIATILCDQDVATAAPGTRCEWCSHPSCVVRSREFSLR